MRKSPTSIAVLSVILAASISVLFSPAFAQSIPAFYGTTPKQLAGLPGAVIRSESIPVTLPQVASAWRILYRTTGIHGEHAAASGVLVIPKGNAPAEGRPVVAWQHPTCGVSESCAPSLSPNVLKMIPGLAGFLAHGFVVVATDYPGLGTPGPHPYLVGISEGRSVLDAVRAAHNFPEAHASRQFAVWGHSQGGHASLFAAILAHSYAPELHLYGVAVAAPASNLVPFANLDTSNPDSALMGAMLLSSWSRVYRMPLSRIVSSSDIPAIEALTKVCFDPPYDSATEQPPDHHPDTPIPAVTWKFAHSLSSVQPWRSLLVVNTPGLPPKNIPVFLAQGSADITIPPALSESYIDKLCHAGNAAYYLSMRGITHRFIAREAADNAVHWITDRFAGKPAPTNCGNSPAP